MVADMIKEFTTKHEQTVHNYVNVEGIQLLDQDGRVRRLKRINLFVLV